MTIPTKLNKDAQSEFGSGLVICLVKFAEHAERWLYYKKTYAERHQSSPNEEWWTEGHVVMMFFNGASDHLDEIKVPKRWRGTEIDKKIAELRNLSLEIGHGFRHTREYTEEDVIRAYDLCREIALLIDEKLGLKPDIGKW